MHKAKNGQGSLEKDLHCDDEDYSTKNIVVLVQGRITRPWNSMDSRDVPTCVLVMTEVTGKGLSFQYGPGLIGYPHGSKCILPLFLHYIKNSVPNGS